MNDLWICTANGKDKIGFQCVQSVVTAHEVRWLAAIRFGVEPMAVDVQLLKQTDLAPADGVPDWRALGSPTAKSALDGATIVQVRWEGNDFNHGGGSANRRRLQVRESENEEWVDA